MQSFLLSAKVLVAISSCLPIKLICDTGSIDATFVQVRFDSDEQEYTSDPGTVGARSQNKEPVTMIIDSDITDGLIAPLGHSTQSGQGFGIDNLNVRTCAT